MSALGTKGAVIGARIRPVPRGGVRAIRPRAILGHPRAVVGAVLMGLAIAMALVGIVWTPYDPMAMDVSNAFQPFWHVCVAT